MSYAGRLVAMARGEVPRVGAPSEPAIVQEDYALATPPAARGPAAAVIAEARRPSPALAEAPSEGTVAPSRAMHTTTVVPSRAMHTTLVERVREVAVPAVAPPPAELRIEETAVERVVLPAPLPRWLADVPSATDPLVASADTDALAELMRSVRQWTSSPPTIVETHASTSRNPAVQVIEAAAPPVEPVQVTIGNVVITVEDAPAAVPRGRPTPPTRATSDRLARNHIRGT